MEFQMLSRPRVALAVACMALLPTSHRLTAWPPAIALDPIKAPATSPSAQAPSTTSEGYGNTLTGDWFGWRNKLADHGVSLAGEAINDGSWNLLGGKSTRKFISRARMTLGLILNTRQFSGWPGGQLHASIRFHFGPNGNDQQLGSIQGFSFIDDAPPATQLYEFYYRQRFFDGQWSVRVGTMDANNIFDIPVDASDFANPSATDAPLYLQNAPPFTAPGLVVTWHAARRTTLIAGAFYNDRFHPTALAAMLNTLEPVNQPVGTFFTAELDQAYGLGSRMPGVVGIGGFWRTGKLPTLDGGFQSGAGGGYLFVDQTLWQSRHTIPRLAIFGNVTGNHPQVSEIDYSIQSGLLDIGPIPGREDDKIGLGLDWAHISTLSQTPKPYELATECFYELACGHGIVLQPDIQYFINTGGGVYADGLIALIRVSVNF
ncbi:MAG: hypothetical protein HKL95_04950 [Phycisphaerae bacterium]|nr:hypothetical protein [Phycisphaerae bacterium]